MFRQINLEVYVYYAMMSRQLLVASALSLNLPQFLGAKGAE